VGVTGQVLEHALGTGEGRLAVDDPVGVGEALQEGIEGARKFQRLEGAVESELILAIGCPEIVKKLAAKERTDDVHREKEAGT
jgi:hypothetical protein|tara:strand:- start:1540 stop:1788 length:249 start_codon:yes stop_codon:yes gene_type:complete